MVETVIDKNKIKGYYRTNNLNEATYLVLSGAEILEIKPVVRFSRKYANQPKIKQKYWKFYLKNVPEMAMDLWAYNKAQWNIRDFIEKRKELKKLGYEKRSGHRVNNFIKFV